MNHFDPIAGVVSLREKCRVSCCRHLDNACDFSEPYSMPWQAMVHLICNVKQNDEASSFSQSFLLKYFALTELDGLDMSCVAMERCPSTQTAQKRQCRPKKTWDELF